ncbi:MAG: M48 family metallopeptidase [Pseudomonadales bacterium]|nr:M48 family metallopeptidase [Pseudomonadales bacterium]
MTFLRPTLLTLACLLASPSFADDLPSLGDASSSIVSPQQEYQLGRAWLSMLRGQVAQLNDPQLKDYVETSVYKLVETSQVQDRRLEFILIDSPQLNAFAAPGGIIGVNGGLFLNAQTEGEYASVMAHELAHLSQRHFARGVEAQQRMQLPMMAALLAGIIVAASGAGDAGIAAIAGSQAAALQEQRRFSRQNEQEADRIGILNLEKAGYDPRSMPTMFERLMRQYRFDAKPPEFLLTHPVTESRVADARSRAEQLPTHANLVQESLEYQLMRNRVRLAFDEEPSHAIKVFESELDNKNDRVKTAAQYGLALAYAKAGQDSKANATLKPLLDSEPNRISYIVAFAEINSRSQSQSDVEALLRKHLALNPDNYALSMALARCLSAKQDYAAARSLLEKISQQRPNDPAVWFKLAEANGFTHNTIGIHLASAEYYILKGNMDQAMQQLDYAYQKSDKSFQLTTLIEKRKADIQAYREELELF